MSDYGDEEIDEEIFNKTSPKVDKRRVNDAIKEEWEPFDEDLEELINNDIWEPTDYEIEIEENIEKQVKSEDNKIPLKPYENKRVVLDRDELKLLINQLKINNKLTLNLISKSIGTNIKNILYGYSNSLNGTSFIKLEKLSGTNIPHNIIDEEDKALNLNDYKFILKRDEKLAEMIGIILGDGSLFSKNKNGLIISLNLKDEELYVKYVYNFMNNLFKNFTNKEKGIGQYNNVGGGIRLAIYGKKIVKELLSHGLVSGNKVENQIRVPEWIEKPKEWIKNNKEIWSIEIQPLVAACLKGLTDTDGSISINRRDKTIMITFKNASLPLAKDFKDMCESLNIRTQPKITECSVISKITGKLSKGYQVTISSKREMNKFIKLVKPMKWEYGKEKLEEKLQKIDCSLMDVFKYKITKRK
jgi:hypothetical protein